MNVRSILAVFVAVLSLLAFDGVEAGKRKDVDRKCGMPWTRCCKDKRKCGDWLKCVGGKWGKCIPCGGKNQIACKGGKCKDPYVLHVNKWGKKICVKKKLDCGKKGQVCCKRKRWPCKRGLVCKLVWVGRKKVWKCVKPKCGKIWQPCCKRYSCKRGLKCGRRGVVRGKCIPRRRRRFKIKDKEGGRRGRKMDDKDVMDDKKDDNKKDDDNDKKDDDKKDDDKKDDGKKDD